MRILIIAHGFPPTHIGGAERRAERMARWLLANGHYVEVVALEHVHDPLQRMEASEQDGFTVHRLFYNVKEGEDDYLAYFHHLYDHPYVGKALRHLIAQHSFDLAHIISGFMLGAQAIDAVRDLGLPVAITLTEYWWMCTRINLVQTNDLVCSGPETYEKCARCVLESQRRYRLPAQAAPALMNVFWPLAHRMELSKGMVNALARRAEVLRGALNRADLVICPSQFLMHKFAEYGFDTTRYRYIRQGLAGTVGELPPRQPRDGQGLRLGYTGQIMPHKAVDLIIQAVSELIDEGERVTLDIWGNLNEMPEYTAQLQARITSYPAIQLRGTYGREKVWEVFSNMDAAVCPSRWYENSPNVILEAFKMGIPVVATNLGGMAELIEHNISGLLFEIDNIADLKAQIRRLIHEPTLLDELREGIPPVKTIHDEMVEMVAAYEELVKAF
jgi:glycosyltransferase involved in cell wall biosynthesis